MMPETFQFVTLSHPGEVKRRCNQSLIRSHAVRRTRGLTVTHEHVAKRQLRRLSDELHVERSPSVTKLDPFNVLPQSPERLRVLMRHKNARQAGEPIFCTSNVGRMFLELDAVFHGALSDPALFHALSLSLALAANDGTPNVECLTHRGKALKEISKSLTSALAEVPGSQVIPVSTLSAMMLMVGYEYRTEGPSRENATMHMQAIDQVIDMCNRSNVFFCHTIRRAVFWQDLTSCFLVGSKRFLTHTCLPELHWMRDPYRASFYTAPRAFLSLAHFLPGTMMLVLEDLNALNTLLEARCMCGELPISGVQTDNAQAWIESRLVDLLTDLRSSEAELPVYEACILAVYAYTYMLSTNIWEGDLIPGFCTARLLGIMQKAEAEDAWAFHPELLLWLLFVGGSFANKRIVRLQFVALILGSYRHYIAHLHATWEGAERTFKDFLWCNQIVNPAFRKFWEELHPN